MCFRAIKQEKQNECLIPVILMITRIKRHLSLSRTVT